MALSKSDIVSDSLKIFGDNLPSLMTIIGVNGKKLNFKQILLIIFAPMIVNLLKIYIEKIQRYRLTYQFSHKLAIDNVNISPKSTTVEASRAAINVLEILHGKQLAISDMRFYNYTVKNATGIRCAACQPDNFSATIEINQESINRFKNMYEKYNIPNMDTYYKSLLGKKITIIRDDNKTTLFGTEMTYLTNFMSIVITSNELKNESCTSMNQMYYEVNSSDSSCLKNPTPLIYSRGFDKIFLPSYSQLKNRVRKWISQKNFYKSRDLAFKLCLLLWGLSGSGKTSFGCAVAVELKYNFIRVEIKDSYEWIFDLLRKTTRTVFLFDELDRMLVTIEGLIKLLKQMQ